MPSTQAFSVDWTVTIEPEGDVSDDVSEITIIREKDVNSATVSLDTSQQPHALEEQQQITIEITDGNSTVEFDGFTDSVKDDETRPLVTVDARSKSGTLDDHTAVAFISGATDLWAVVDQLVDELPGKIRGVTFDAQSHRDQYGSLTDDVNFGNLTSNYTEYGDGAAYDLFNQAEIASEIQAAEIRWNYYVNTTEKYYTLRITGEDGDGFPVEATVDLPPATSPTAAFGTDSFKLALNGGSGKWKQVNSISTDITEDPPTGNELVHIGADLWNFIKRDWQWTLSDITSAREAIQSIVDYIDSRSDQDWEFFVDGSTSELKIQPVGSGSPTRHVFREGDNVEKPVAKRDLDGVRNMVKVEAKSPSGIPITRWAWAYEGLFYIDPNNPFVENDFGNVDYPDGAVGESQSLYGFDGTNDIDEIGLRAERLSGKNINTDAQAIELAQRALRAFYRTPVSGKAPVPGIQNISVGDEAEVYYPSRGIPQKVADNVYQIEKVEYSITPEKAVTTAEFGTSQPNMGDQIAAGGSIIRNDIDDSILSRSQNITNSNQAGTEEQRNQTFPVPGELIEKNSDGTWVVEAEDGVRYENVNVV